MGLEAWISTHLEGTLLAERLLRLDDLYNRVTVDIQQWVVDSQFPGCPAGCGSCCASYVPQVYSLEALYTAAGCLARDIDYTPVFNAEAVTGHCLFYREDTPGHCGIYEARPLLCRTFGYTSSRDKGGTPQFRLCRHMPPAPVAIIPPPASDYGMELLGILNDPMPRMYPLHTELIPSLNTLRAIIDYRPFTPGSPTLPGTPPKAA